MHLSMHFSSLKQMTTPETLSKVPEKKLFQAKIGKSLICEFLHVFQTHQIIHSI